MNIENIHIENYKVFKKLELRSLPKLAIFVGKNGTGKSTLFDLFGFLSDALQNNINQALAKRGGFKEVISRDKEDSKDPKEDAKEDAEEDNFIKIELQFRLKIVGKERLVTYRLELGLKNEVPYIARELLRYKRSSYGSPFHFLDFSNGEGYAITNEEDFSKQDKDLTREYQKLDSPDILAIKGLGQFEKFKAASAFRNFIENWHVSDFHISEARPSRDAGYAEHLSQSGDNLPLVAQYMYLRHREIFDRLLEKMKERVPGVEKVEAEPTVDGRIVLKFGDSSFKAPFIARYVSDGTIKMFAYLILLNDPRPHPLLCIEEPENQLYPKLLSELLEEFREYATKKEKKEGGQVFITSHSPDLLNSAEPEEVYWLQKEKGYTIVKRASEDKKITAMAQAGEKLGYLWEQGYFV